MLTDLFVYAVPCCTMLYCAVPCCTVLPFRHVNDVDQLHEISTFGSACGTGVRSIFFIEFYLLHTGSKCKTIKMADQHKLRR